MSVAKAGFLGHPVLHQAEEEDLTEGAPEQIIAEVYPTVSR